MEFVIEAHPSIDARLFTTRLPAMASPDWLRALLVLEAPVDAGVPVERDEHTRVTVRDLLRHGGYKPTGRGKPASEYLVRAAGDGTLGSINLAVDACNVVSLHSGLPISVIDCARAQPPMRIAIAEPGMRHVFNPAGQEIEVSGLLCLFDREGPCANAVKDAQRTKTDDGTRETLSVIWGHRALSDRVDAALAWYRELLERAGAETALLSSGGPR